MSFYQFAYFFISAERLMDGLCALIGKLLEEKNPGRGDALSRKWLENEAAAPENINKAGTFR